MTTKTTKSHENKDNIKWIDKPLDRLTVLRRVEGLTTLSQPVESLKVEPVEGHMTLTNPPMRGIGTRF